MWHGYDESAVFSPKIAKAYEMLMAGGIGKLLTMRAREGHSGPHAPHFWNAETAGGGALLDMGCHTNESARHFFGKDNPVAEVMAWGATLLHTDKTKGEDACIVLLKFAGGQLASLRSSWIEGRHAAAPRAGRFQGTDRHRQFDRAGVGFRQPRVGYTVEKADSDTGPVYPVPGRPALMDFPAMRHL